MPPEATMAAKDFFPPDCHPKIARILTTAADKACQGRAVAILCGGSRRDIARYCIPRIINFLAE